MSAHGGQDWLGCLIVVTAVSAAVILDYLVARAQLWWDTRANRRALASMRAAALVPVDHADCANPDCDQVVCLCRKVAECDGSTSLGCTHGEGLCWDCRLGCPECAAEHSAELYADWAAGR